MPHRPVAAALAVLILGVAGCGENNSVAGPDPSPSTKEATTPPAPATGSNSAASGTDVTGPRTTVSMTDFAFRPEALSARAGKLRVTAENHGGAEHELVLIRTMRRADALPREGAQASEAGSVGEIPEQEPGKSESHTFVLKPGAYVYICNVPGHYAAGMHGTLTVR